MTYAFREFKSKEPLQELLLWIVVCMDFHSAYGPYGDFELAAAESQILNETQSECLYIPVKLKAQGKASVEGEPKPSKPKREEKDSGHPGQYL